jgi:UDPglucose--hexose-1-phosphate uridylyltransferase
MPVECIRQVIETWTSEYQTLGALPQISAVTIFENRGAMMGASSPHPHGQIWANETIPNEVRRESMHQLQYLRRRSRCLLCDYVALEEGARERVVCGNSLFVAVVPFWAVWPFETLVLPRRHVGALDELDGAGREAFGQILKEVTMRYDRLFGVSFPYSMGIHQRPTDGHSHSQWHCHAHFYPPLLRSATVSKFYAEVWGVNSVFFGVFSAFSLIRRSAPSINDAFEPHLVTHTGQFQPSRAVTQKNLN